jgi:hypothetical protein
MKKHKYNIFPEANAEDFTRLVDDIRINGFDKKQPVTLYQGEVLDGWNRTKACQELGINPPTVIFTGTDSDAVAFVMRTNKRRNLNKGQWACIAADADDLLVMIRLTVESNSRAKQAATQSEQYHKLYLADKKLSASHHANTTPTKAAELFNTNRTYVNQAVKMKAAAPEVFEKVKAGKMASCGISRLLTILSVDT